MQTTPTSVLNPRWANAERTCIDCEITVLQFGDEILPFTAASTDVEAHGRDLFADIVAGKYGAIQEYVTPPEPEPQPQPLATVTGAQTL
jgi:hypothetical protein